MLRDHREGIRRVARRNQHFEELGGDRVERLRVDWLVECDDAAERGHWIRRERLSVGVERRVGDGGAARVGVLDDDTRRAVRGIGERLYAFPRCVGISEVVVREILALKLPVGRDTAGDGRFVPVEGGVLSGSAGPQRRLRSGRLHSKTQKGALAPPILGFTACKAPHRRLFRSEDGTAVAPMATGRSSGQEDSSSFLPEDERAPALRVFVLRIFRHSSQLCTDSGPLSCLTGGLLVRP